MSGVTRVSMDVAYMNAILKAYRILRNAQRLALGLRTSFVLYGESG